ncbi:MAG: serine hydrolase domain-containing protein [Minicystis sp.]
MLRRSFVFLTCLLIGCGSETIPHEDPKPDAGAPDASPDAPVDAGGWTDTPITPRYQALADAIETERASHGNTGVAVLVMEKGKIAFARGFGNKDPDTDDPVHATTLFRIGSATKMLTATAALQQVAAKKVALEDKVTELIPGFSIGGVGEDQLSFFHLLSHSSGINDLTPIYGKGPQLEDAWLAKYTTGGFKTAGYFQSPPGSMYNYANPNFALAGLIAERTTGNIYRQTVQDNVFNPLGMKRTFFLGADVAADGDFASADTVNLDTGKPEKVGAPGYDQAWMRPAGFAWSSVLDLAVFLQFLLDGNPAVLPDEQRKAMQTAQVSTKLIGDHLGYGFGLFVQDATLLGSPSQLYPLHVVSHTGAIPGYSASFSLIPEQGFALITLANTDDAYFEDSFEVAVDTLTELPAPILARPHQARHQPVRQVRRRVQRPLGHRHDEAHQHERDAHRRGAGSRRRRLQVRQGADPHAQGQLRHHHRRRHLRPDLHLRRQRRGRVRPGALLRGQEEGASRPQGPSSPPARQPAPDPPHHRA